MTDPGWDVADLGRRVEAGEGEAAHRLAVLAASGVNTPFDPEAALRHLEIAGRLGHPTAAEQLGLIAGEGGLGAFLAPRPARPVSQRPHVLIADGFVTPAVCDWLRGRAEPRLEPAQVYDPATGEGRIAAIRTNSAMAFQLEDLDVVMALVREKLARLAGLPAHGLEPCQVLHYRPGQTFDWHVDYFDPATPGHREQLARRGQRIATCLIWLNDDYEGGETAFAAGDLRLKGKTGDAVLWANVTPRGAIEPLSRHAGLPPTAGEKWVLSQWIRPRPPPP